MRAIDVRVSADGGEFGPFHGAVVGSHGISLRALHEIRLLNDGTTVMLYEYQGDPAVAERLAENHLTPTGVEWQTATIQDAQLMYANAEPSPLVAGLVTMLDEWRVVVDWPLVFLDDEEFRVRLLGDGREIRDALSHVPDEIELTIDRTGDYRPEREDVVSRLTKREREVLEAAVDLGYYRNPRGTNYAELAAELECSTGTVGEHLRNAEAKVMTELLGDPPTREQVETPEPVS